MKVLMVNNLYAPNVRGGAERSVQLLAESLVRAGVEVTVATTDERAGAPVDVNGVKVVTLALANLYWPFGNAAPSPLRRKLWHLLDVYNPLMSRRLLQLMRTERPDVVHTNNLQGISAAAWRAADVASLPVLHTLRDYYLSCARAMRFRNGTNCTQTCLDCAPFCAARRALSQRVAGVVGTSRFILDHHLQLGFFRRTPLRRAIFNSTIDGGALRKSGGPTLTFGYLGRLEQMKGVELLLRAFEGRADSRWQLLIAGSGTTTVVDEWRRRAESAARPDQIRFLGWTDAAEFLAQVDVIIVPSQWHEPLSRVVLEAHANGIPVIASRRGGLAEVADYGAGGILFEPDEPGSLSRAIDALLQDPALVVRLGSEALQSAERFRPQVIASQYLEAYEEMKSSKFKVQGSKFNALPPPAANGSG